MVRPSVEELEDEDATDDDDDDDETLESASLGLAGRCLAMSDSTRLLTKSGC